MSGLIADKHYEIVHPVTGRKEVWTGERIEAYKVNYGSTVEEAKDKPKKRTRKTTKDV